MEKYIKKTPDINNEEIITSMVKEFVNKSDFKIDLSKDIHKIEYEIKDISDKLKYFERFPPKHSLYNEEIKWLKAKEKSVGKNYIYYHVWLHETTDEDEYYMNMNM